MLNFYKLSLGILGIFVYIYGFIFWFMVYEIFVRYNKNKWFYFIFFKVYVNFYFVFVKFFVYIIFVVFFCFYLIKRIIWNGFLEFIKLLKDKLVVGL